MVVAGSMTFGMFTEKVVELEDVEDMAGCSNTQGTK